MPADLIKPRHLWISGLRRSGTTAIWRMFRGMEGFTCYDEPFNPKMETHLPNQHRKGTWDEFIALWHDDGDAFRSAMTFIDPVGELRSEATDGEVAYLTYLTRQPTVIDFTRTSFLCGDLMQRFPDSVWVFLFRSPIAFATSHLINSENRKFLRQEYYRLMFFTRVLGFDSWGMQTIAEARQFELVLDDLDIRPKVPPSRMKSAEKLLLLWLAVRRVAEGIVRKDTEQRAFLSSYEAIIDGTCDGMAGAVRRMGMAESGLDRSHFRSYSAGFRSDSAHWVDMARTAGFSNDEIDQHLRKESR